MSSRRLSVIINGPEGMLDSMAALLRGEGYLVVAPGAPRSPATVARARVGELESLVRESLELWHEWSTTDIAADDDHWAAFTDRVHAWLIRARERTGRRAAPRTRGRVA
jgi:hypothetical protein